MTGVFLFWGFYGNVQCFSKAVHAVSLSKNLSSNSFTSHTLQLENSRVHIFRLYHVFFFACVCNMQWLVCSRKLAQAQHLFYREIPERTQLFPASVVSGLTWLEPLVCLHELSSTGEYRPLRREMESRVTENAASEASTEFEISPDHTTSWKSAWWVIWDWVYYCTLLSLYRSLPWPFLCPMH